MPSKSTTDVSLTIRFGVPIVPIVSQAQLVQILDKRASHYVIGYEQLGDESTGHYQCAVRLSSAVKTENTKQWIIRELKALKTLEWTEDHLKFAVKASPHHDLETLAGGYCRKQDSNPIVKGWDRATLLAGEIRYQEVKDAKQKKIPVSKSAFVPLIRQYMEIIVERTSISPDRDEKWSGMTNKQRYEFLERLIISDGYDMSTISIFQVNHVIKNFNDYFGNFKNSKNLLDEFFE